MPNGINYELDFEKRIAEMKDRQLLEFVARQTLEVCERLDKHSEKIKVLENGDKKSSSIAGGITGTVTGVIIGLVNYFINRN